MRAPIRGVGDETNPRGRRQTRRPPQRQTPDRLGASQACLKTPTAKIRKTRAPRTARIEPNKCPSGPKLGQNKTTAARDGVKNRRSRGASAKLRRRRAPDGREKSAANAVAPSLGNRSESALFRIAQKPTRSAGRESPAPILAKPGAAIPTESLFLQCAADAANRPGWFSRPAPGRRTNPTRDAARNGRSPRRERLEQPSRKTTPKPNGKQAGGENGGSSASRAKRRPKEIDGRSHPQTAAGAKTISESTPSIRGLAGAPPRRKPANRRRNFPSF